MPAPSGQFIWYDVMTNDPKAATSFYSDVIGWEAQEYAMPDRSYTVFRRGPVMVAGAHGDPGDDVRRRSQALLVRLCLGR